MSTYTSYNPGNVTVRNADGQTTEVQFNSSGLLHSSSKFVLKVVDNEASVGIGTSNPHTRLTVVDHISCTGNVYASGGQLATGVGSSKFTEPGGNVTHLTETGNKVGIGTAAPGAKLTVAGAVSAQGKSTFTGGLQADSTIYFTSLSASVSGTNGIAFGVNQPTEFAWSGEAKSSDQVDAKLAVPKKENEPLFIGEYFASYTENGFFADEYSIKAGFVAVSNQGVSTYEFLNAQSAKMGLWLVHWDASNSAIAFTKQVGTASPANLSGRWYVRVRGSCGFPSDDYQLIE